MSSPFLFFWWSLVDFSALRCVDPFQRTRKDPGGPHHGQATPVPPAAPTPRGRPPAFSRECRAGLAPSLAAPPLAATVDVWVGHIQPEGPPSTASEPLPQDYSGTTRVTYLRPRKSTL